MYKLFNNTFGQLENVMRLSDGIFIPLDDENRDYQQFKLWLEKGNTPEPSIDFSLSENKSKAQYLLSETDWVEIPSVTDVNNTPHLLNLDDFITYRSQLRSIIVNETSGEINWPVKPSSVWSQ